MSLTIDMSLCKDNKHDIIALTLSHCEGKIEKGFQIGGE